MYYLLKSPELIYEDEKVSVHTIPLDHRFIRTGFCLKKNHLNAS